MTFEEVFTYEHLFEAGKECCKGVRWKSSVQNFEMQLPRWVATIYDELYNGTYKSKGFTTFTITERGKTRKIQAVHISERMVQKCLCKYCLKPLIEPTLVYDNSANIKGKGTDFAIKRLKKQLAHHYKKHGLKGGILLIDYHNYFGSIRHDVVLEQLKKIIKDERLYKLIEMFVNCFDKVGLGLGSEISQVLAIYYANRIDHILKEQYHIGGYGKYMDDSYCLYDDIDYLFFIEQQVRIMSADIGLELNGRTRVVPLTDGFMYLKKRFRLTESGKVVVRLSRNNITAHRVKIKKQAKKGIDAKQSHECWRGYAKHYNAHDTLVSMDALYDSLFTPQKGQ